LPLVNLAQVRALTDGMAAPSNHPRMRDSDSD
jgi:hypothetical protein